MNALGLDLALVLCLFDNNKLSSGTVTYLCNQLETFHQHCAYTRAKLKSPLNSLKDSSIDVSPTDLGPYS